jgi:hypothetical protein
VGDNGDVAQITYWHGGYQLGQKVAIIVEFSETTIDLFSDSFIALK